MSEIPMLQGWYDQLAPGMQSIGAGIANLINPNYAAQQALKAEIAKNPETLQQLSDAEAMNPGSVSHIFGRQVNSIIGPASADAQNKIDLRDGRSLDSITASNTARDQGLSRAVTGVNKNEGIVQANNAELSNAGLAGKKKEALVAEQDADTKLGAKDLRTQTYLSNLQAEQKKNASDMQVLTNRIDNFGSLKGLNLSKLATKVARSGQLTPQEEQQIRSVQGDADTAKTFGALVEGMQRSDQLAQSWRIHQHTAAQDDKLMRRQAFSLAEKLNVPGHIDAVMAYLDKPESAERARLLAEGKLKPESKMDEGLLAVENAQRKVIATADTNLDLKQEAHDIQERTERSRVAAQVINTIDKIRKQKGRGEDDAETQAGVYSVNQNLATLTGGKIRYEYQPVNYGSDKEKFIMNVNGRDTNLTYDQVNEIMNGPSEMQVAQEKMKSDPLEQWRKASPADIQKKLSTMDPATRKKYSDKLTEAGIKH
jgi:hypothetical protein